MKIYYFDNSATSNPKPEIVYEKINYAMRELNSNSGRGSHRLAIENSQKIYRVREQIAKFFGLENSLNVAFTSNSTMSLNIAISGILDRDDFVVTTYLEHNSVIRPIFKMVDEKNLKVYIIKKENMKPENIQNENIEEEFESLILELKNSGEKLPKALIINHMSNVTGKSVDLKKIGKVCRENKILLVVDASQSAGVINIDMEEMFIDILCFTGHKYLFGMQGIGGICVREGVKINSLLAGGTGTHSKENRHPHEMPELLEAGTLNTPGIISLDAGISFINSVGLDKIYAHEKNLKEKFLNGIKNLPLKIYSSYGEHDGAVVSINILGIPSSDLSSILDEEYNIMTRSGLHCSPLIHEFLGTEDDGAVRFSFGYFNTEEEINYAIESIKKIISLG
ncbi:MAG: aminotransferase class V-fold PLP-dependent enzyme [Fusobacteriaceae bacterium]